MTTTNKELKQEIFDYVYSCMEKQNWQRSMSTGSWPGVNRCRYRGNNGMKCAIGHLIPDDKYKPEFDETEAAFFSFSSLIDLGVIYSPKGTPLTYSYDLYFFLESLQWCHDDGKTPEQMRKNFDAVIPQYGLNPPAAPANELARNVE